MKDAVDVMNTCFRLNKILHCQRNKGRHNLIVVSPPKILSNIAVCLPRRHPFPMNNLNSLLEIARAIRNLIRIGIATDVDLDEGCVASRPAACEPPGLTGSPVAQVALVYGGLT